MVEVCTDEIFGKLIELVQPILDAVENKVRLVVPPQPRYLFSPCCSERSHCSNVGVGTHAEGLLAGCFRLRAILKRRLLTGSANIPPWVMDTCCSVYGSEKTVVEKLEVLKRVSASDGVHFTAEGNGNVAKNICETLEKLQSGNLGKTLSLSRAVAVPKAGTEIRHVWRGFSSPVGSLKRSASQSWGKFPKDRAQRDSQPYKRWGRGGRSFWKN